MMGTFPWIPIPVVSALDRIKMIREQAESGFSAVVDGGCMKIVLCSVKIAPME